MVHQVLLRDHGDGTTAARSRKTSWGSPTSSTRTARCASARTPPTLFLTYDPDSREVSFTLLEPPTDNRTSVEEIVDEQAAVELGEGEQAALASDDG